jgi:hypothetical protein
LSALHPQRVATNGSIDSYVRWLEACEHLRRAYKRWLTCEMPQRRLAFDGYLRALDREEHAASIHWYWAERLQALER